VTLREVTRDIIGETTSLIVRVQSQQRNFKNLDVRKETSSAPRIAGARVSFRGGEKWQKK
jgi:hypothetical protein